MKSLANIELIWALFIIITVVAQIVKGAKKVASKAPGKTEEEGAPGSPRETPDRGEREDELRKFLESLAGGRPRAPKPATVPPPMPPPARRQPPPARPKTRVVAQPPPPPRPKPAPPPPEPVEAEAPTTMHVQTFRAKRRTSALQNILLKELRNNADRRKSVVLREILGPPIALKPLEWRV